MANHYVRSAATGAADGTSWADAYTTMVAAFGAGSAGDTFWIADDHSESTAGTIYLSSPGTAASPCRAVCVSDHTTEPPTALGTGAVIATTGTTDIRLEDICYWYGVEFRQGTGGSSRTMYLGQAGGETWLYFENCHFNMNNTGASSVFSIGDFGSSGDGQQVILKNSTFELSNANQAIRVRCPFEWIDTADPCFVGATTPNNVFKGDDGPSGSVKICGVDLDSVGSGTLVLVSGANNNQFNTFDFIDCKLNASTTIASGAAAGPGAERIRLVNCDSSDTNYRYQLDVFAGVITQETTIVKTSGASDGTTTVSRKMVTNANSDFLYPLYSDWMPAWNETVGSSITVTIPTVTDNVTLQDDEAWIEVEYLGTSGFPLASFTDDRMADIFATAANQTTDSTSTWTTTGLTTPVKQELSVSFTPQEKGAIRVRVGLAKPSTTMYFDPLNPGLIT